MGGVSFKQFSRTYPGNISFNFAIGLSSTNDFKVKTYSNFYLTNRYTIDQIMNIDNTPLIASNIFGDILFGSEYLKFENIDSTEFALSNRYQDHFNYGVSRFDTTNSDNTKFNIEILDDNNCRIYFTKNYKKFYLSIDINNDLYFVKESLLPFDEDVINPQDFTYIYSKSNNNIFFFKRTSSNTYILTKSGNSLSLNELTDDNVITYINFPFKISKNLYTYPNINQNTSFITYNNDNTVNYDNSIFDLKNNYLLHNRYSETSGFTDIIVLKNQVLQDEVFSLSNNLLSSNNPLVYGDKLREYSCIGDDIDTSTTESLELNYVFYNKSYKILPGSNEFVSPSSIAPFIQLNVNDTKFVSSGSFAYQTPEYADKLYHLSNDLQNYNDGQYLLCTWLSGSSLSENKIWVDRYYYPDLISKEDAISQQISITPTYNNYIENLIQNNSDLKDSIKSKRFFDKLSDLVFVPNERYLYERVDKTKLPSLSSAYASCNLSNPIPTNYFKTINESGELTVGFSFNGDTIPWIVESDRNLIDSGITITKTETDITFTCNIYDSTTYEYDDSPESWFSYNASNTFKSMKDNFVCVSLNTKTGIGYFILNNEIVQRFKLPAYQILIKQILYGDFYLLMNNKKVDLLSESTPFTNVIINNYFTPPEKALIISLMFNETIDPIYITLPCGMRNSSDDIVLLNSICNSPAFKSNNINLNIKNLEISDTDVLDGIATSIRQNIENVIPPNITINNINFKNYK